MFPPDPDQTPTPTRFLKNCEEVGLFNELASSFEHEFKKAAEDDEKKARKGLGGPGPLLGRGQALGGTCGGLVFVTRVTLAAFPTDPRPAESKFSGLLFLRRFTSKRGGNRDRGVPKTRQSSGRSCRSTRDGTKTPGEPPWGRAPPGLCLGGAGTGKGPHLPLQLPGKEQLSLTKSSPLRQRHRSRLPPQPGERQGLKDNGISSESS